ncbi:unnamed protein product [Linum tenue]|uniref:Uncharacterized protein n=1 Tax=Linum tenue TaxID=586396 RepID=A0AAV0I150_9ROSI|nr:unnamed protein product [Linum tenue]
MFKTTAIKTLGISFLISFRPPYNPLELQKSSAVFYQRVEMAEEAKVAAIVPESVLKKRKRNDEWALAKTQAAVAQKKKSAENRKIIFKRAEQYSKEYKDGERELIRLKREAKLKGGFYVSPEAKLLFIVRIRGINAMDPKTRKILQLFRLRQIFNGVFLKVNKATVNMLRRVEPYVTYGYGFLLSFALNHVFQDPIYAEFHVWGCLLVNLTLLLCISGTLILNPSRS